MAPPIKKHKKANTIKYKVLSLCCGYITILVIPLRKYDVHDGSWPVMCESHYVVV